MNKTEKATTKSLNKSIIAYFTFTGVVSLFGGLMMLFVPLREKPLSSEEIQTLIVVPQIIFLTKYKFHISLFIPSLLAFLWCCLPGRKLTNILGAFVLFIIMHITIRLVIESL